MKVIILGSGTIGSVIASLLSGRNETERLLVADRNLEAARNLAQKLPRGSAEAAKVDAGRVDEMARIFKDFDLVVNVVLPRFNLKIMEACLQAGVHYTDAATDLALAREKPGEPVNAPPEKLQLDLDPAFRDAGLTGLLGMGADPGLTNVLARLGAGRLDTVDEILVRDGDNGYVEGFEFASLWSPDTLIEEVLMPALAFRGGQFVRLGSLEGEETFDFPAPVGALTVYNVDHEETNTLPLFIGKGLKDMDFKIALSKDLADALRVFQKFGLHRGDLIDVEVKATGETARVAPRDVLTALMPNPREVEGKARGQACLAVVVRGTKGGKKDGWRLWCTLDHQECYRRYGCSATSYPVGALLAVGALMLARGEISRKGVFPPEALDPAPFLRHLPDFGIPVEERRLT
ncbi:MAG: saccharopine dehydrogenase C-terminal domain-containing protein [Candidatus Thermoplasmatota archaeon]